MAERIPKLLTVQQLAAATGLPVWRVDELASQKKLPFLRVGKCYRFAEDAVARWIQEQQSNINPQQQKPALIRVISRRAPRPIAPQANRFPPTRDDDSLTGRFISERRGDRYCQW
jgi:excisionase family DNA binding protein